MARAASLTVSLNSQLKQYVRQQVDSGKFPSASEVVRHGLRTMQQQDSQQRTYWADVRGKLREARVAIEAGDVVDGAKFMKAKVAALSTASVKGKSGSKRAKMG
jgi:putative addiction module CopG family antidote